MHSDQCINLVIACARVIVVVIAIPFPVNVHDGDDEGEEQEDEEGEEQEDEEDEDEAVLPGSAFFLWILLACGVMCGLTWPDVA